MSDDSRLSHDWLTDRIVKFSQHSDFRQRAESAAFRLDAGDPYLRLHFVNVYVRDQERSLRFFVDKLGFLVVADAVFASGNRWVEVSPPDGTAVLALVLPTEGRDEEHLVGASVGITFLTENVEWTYQEWSRRGVRFTIPPQRPAWGGTFCRFIDPDGNSFALAGFDDVTRSIDRRRRSYAEKIENDRRFEQEIEIAKQVQARLFPQTLPQIDGLEYAGICVQAHSVGGDYYDFLGGANGPLALILGDIAGKGIAAALLMANLQATVRSQFVNAAGHPDQLLESVNKLLFENTNPSAYATLFYGEYDARTGRFNYANCGHPSGLILGTNGVLRRLESTTTVLGLFDDWRCSMSSVQLEPGDLLLLCTDGITESSNEQGEEFGERQLVETVRGLRMLPVRELATAVIESALAFSRGVQHDDLTLIVARRTTSK